MLLITINKYKYKVVNDENIILGHLSIIDDNILNFDIDNFTLINIFPDFLKEVKKNTKIKYLIYHGDNPYLNHNYLSENNDVIIYLKDYNYLILSEYLKPEIYKDFFIKRGNWKEYKNKNNNLIDLLIIQGDKFLFDKSLWDYNSIINNKVDKDSIKNLKKDSFQNLVSPSLRKSFIVDKIKFVLYPKLKTDSFKEFIDKYKILILKPVDGHGGKEIRMIEGFDDFNKQIKELKKIKEKDNWSVKRNKRNEHINKTDWVLEEYINEPLLYDGKKFHIRVYIIYYNDKKTFIYNKFRLAIAKENYKLEDYKNKDIHDSHFYVYEEKEKMNLVHLDEILEEDKYKYIIDQMVILFSDIFKKIKNECYKETKYCYQIFAPDIMIERDYTIKLLEINTNPGFNKELNLAEDIFENIMYNIIDDILPPKNYIEDPKGFIKLNLNNNNNNISSERRAGFDEIKDINPLGSIRDDINRIKFVDELAKSWYLEGYGPKAIKDKTGGFYLTCKLKKGEINNSDFHIHIVGPYGKIHINSWSKKIKERRKWEALDFRLTPKEQAYHIYVKSGYKNDNKCMPYYKNN
jgi:hypothetical protein